MTTRLRRAGRGEAVRRAPRGARRTEPTSPKVAPRRLQHLYEISKLLTRFVSAGRTLADILLILSEEIPLVTAILLLEGPWGPQTMLWNAEGLGADRLRAAQDNARRCYADMMGSRAHGRLERAPAVVGVLPGAHRASRPGGKEWPAAGVRTHFLVLPLVVERSPVFGALQLESLRALDEVDLGFVNTVVNQLAIVLDRKALFDAQQAASEARRVIAERERAAARDLQTLAEAAEQRYRALVDNLDQAFVWEADAETLQVSHVSAPAEAMLGHPLGRWTEAPQFWLEIVHPAERELFRLATRKARAEGKDQRLDHRVMAADGSVRWLHTGVHVTSERYGPVMQGVSVDITALKEGEARDRLLSEASRLVVVAVDYDDLIDLLARAATPALGEICVIDMIGETGHLEPAAVAFAEPAGAELAEGVRRLAPGEGGQTLKAQVLLSRAAILLQGDAATVVASAYLGGGAARAAPVRSILALPLIAHGRALGVLTVASLRADRYSAPEIALAQEFVLRGALVLDNAWLYRDAERRSRIQKTVTDNAAACLVLVDDDDHPTFMNPAAVTVTGYSLADLGSRRLYHVMHGVEPGATPGGGARWPSPMQGQEDTFVRRDGGSYAVSCNVIPLPSGGAVVEFRDLTVEKQAERFRELFVGMLGHDLRNPLSAIVVSADVILVRGGLVEKYERALRRIMSSAERMSRMIAQILDFTRGRLGGGVPIVRKRVDACEVVKRILDEASAAHPDQVIDAVMPSACEGQWDPDRLEQVVSNLIGNAVAHGRRDRPIEIRVARVGEIVEIGVRNEGAPIPAGLLPVLFDPFRNGAPRGANGHGLGLGLYITERIVDAHGGTIRVRSTAEEGTTFTVTLPVAAGAGEP